MKITAFKTILAQIINIKGCKDYGNIFHKFKSEKPNPQI